MPQSRLVCEGAQVIEQLAELYPQLYLAPGEEGQELYPKVVLQGEPVPVKDLSHFHRSPTDNCRMVETPAGEVRVVTLGDREDYVTFLRIIAHRCKMVEIPGTQGASFLNGVICWGKINQHKEDFYREAREKGEPEPSESQWYEEQGRFVSDKRNYTDALLVLSRGPYSGVPAKEAGIPEEQWPEDSLTIRLYHECTHFVCYRLHPGERDAVKDELVADAVGIIAAYGHFDRRMAECFLGIHDGCYTGGRLENYTDDPSGLIPTIAGMLTHIAKTAEENKNMDPLELGLLLDEVI